TVWDAQKFAGSIAEAGFAIDAVDNDVFVEVWATRNNYRTRDAG
ncbi:MAG: hypothetical protein QOG65_839, partial [Actinomycetota bacterium]|nr:hypothetical protein [Actinomycetota bacterium]